MSTRVGIITEGSIDEILLPPLVEAVAHKRAGVSWPVHAEVAAEILQIRKRGHGGVHVSVEQLVKLDDHGGLAHLDFFIVLLDHKTRDAQERVLENIKGRSRWFLAIAIKEIEAWWLGDREKVLAWAGIKEASLPKGCRYAVQKYSAEKDSHPKQTLNELTELSHRFDRVYGQGIQKWPGTS